MTQSSQNLIWIDLEMTGLDTDHDYIIEIATIITDNHLDVVAEGPVLAINQPDTILNSMDEWNTRQHGKSGLLDRVRDSVETAESAQARTMSFLRQYVPARVSPMCGNSICQDRRFLHRLMPELEQYFHYRNLDVSSVKELYKRWCPSKPQFDKDSSHLAIDDIRDSINELKFYRENFFNLT